MVIGHWSLVISETQQLLFLQGEEILGEIQIPLLEQVLVFGRSQITTQAIQVCLQEDIPIAFLSQMGYCYGRTFTPFRVILCPKWKFGAEFPFLNLLDQPLFDNRSHFRRSPREIAVMLIFPLTRSVAHYQGVLAILMIFISWQINYFAPPLGNGTCNPVTVGAKIRGVTILFGGKRN